MRRAIPKRRGSLKRHTWPRTEVDQLETIVESPQSSPKSKQTIELPPTEPLCQTEECSSIGKLVVQSSTSNGEGDPPKKSDQTQMVWYSHHLTESQRDRERLWNKVEELESVCRSHSKANAKLLQDVSAWQISCEKVEAELVEATQEIEEAKAHIRSIETSNMNLRYALRQAREEQELDRQRRWRTRMLRYVKSCMQISTKASTGGRFKAKKDNLHDMDESYTTHSEPATPPSRPSVKTSRPLISRPPSRMSGSFASEHTYVGTSSPATNSTDG